MQHVVLEPDLTSSDVESGRWMVLIYNNNTNSMDEVVSILMSATGCDEEEAAIEMWEAHTFGKASVHFAAESVCQEVASIISSVGIRTEVTPEWID